MTRALGSTFIAFCFTLGAAWVDYARAASETVSLSGQDVVFDGTSEFYWSEGENPDDDPAHIPPEKWNRASRSPNLGPGMRPVWYRFHVLNNSDTDTSASFVSMASANSELVQLVVDHANGSRDQSKTGTSMSMSERPVTSRLLILPFKLAAEERATIYLGISSNYTRNLLYQIKSPKSLASYEINASLFFGIFFGLLIFFLVVNLVAYIKLGLNLCLTYALFCMSMLLPVFVGDGFLNLLVPSNWTLKSAAIQLVLIPLQIAAACILSRDYLDLKSWNKISWWLATILAGIALLNAAVATTGYYKVELLFLDSVLAITGAGVALSIAVCGLYKDEPSYEKSYILGFGAYILTAIFWTLQIQGFIPTSWWSANGVLVGGIIQNTVVSYVVFGRMKSFITNMSSAEHSRKYANKLSALVRILTHDLSNYITVILFNSRQLVRAGISQDEADARHEAISRAANRQADIIESVRQLQALEDAKNSLELKPVDLGDLFKELREKFEKISHEKGIKLVTPNLNAGDLHVLADRTTLFNNVLSNIISNAIKFSSTGQEVHVITKPSDKNIFIEITDSGIGIPDSIKSSLFTSTANSPRTGTNGEKGTGFGLPIAKSYIDAYGGSIFLESKCKKNFPSEHGTTITIGLKLARAKN